MSFNIGSQSGGVINNVTGNQRVEGGQQGNQITQQAAAAAAATSLRELLADLRLRQLTESERAQVDQDAAAVEEEMASSTPSAEDVRTRLERLTSVLSAAGAFVGAGAGLIGPLTALAQWLGPLGAGVLRALSVA